MASNPVQDLKTKLAVGARPNKYRIMLAAPVGPTDDSLLDVICKGASIPGKTIGTIDIFNQGRKLLIAGDAAFENSWSLTFWDTEDHSLRKSFDKWLTFIDDKEKHQRGWKSHKDYTTEKAKVEQLSTINNSVKAIYEFRNMFPTNMSAIDVADDSNDTLEEFTVDFAYSHWVRID